MVCPTIDQLESFGLVEVELIQEHEPVALTLPVEVSIPLFSSTSFAGGEDVVLYPFDEDIGVWILDGTGTIDSGKFVTNVEHFSWWNCDQPLAPKPTEARAPQTAQFLEITRSR